MKTRTVQLGEVCDFIRGVTFPSGEGNSAPFENSIACLTTSGVQKEVAWESRRFIPKTRVGNSEQVLQSGDILISTANSKELVGKSCLVHRPPFDCTFGAFVTVARPKEEIYPPYLAYWMTTPRHLAWCFKNSSNTTNISNLRVSEFQELEFELPELSEQRRIAERLEQADGLRRTRRYALELSATFLPAAFLQLFGDFSECPSYELSEVCDFITKGSTPSAIEIRQFPKPNDVPFLKVYHINDEGTIEFESTPSFVSSTLHNGTLERSKVYPNDVLMNIVGPPLGKIGIVPDIYPEWNINQALVIFRAKEKLNPTFLLHVLRSRTVLNSILSQAVGIRQQNLSLEQCRNIKIPVPPLALQQKFARLVARVERLRAAQRESLRQAEHLFQSLLNESFHP